jgi:phosphoribosylformimino-5-aminoimidazole carboxamide ribotide isomerase
VNIAETLALASRVSTPVIASGGIGGAAHLRELRDAAAELGAGTVDGVIVGRALYDGALDVAAALDILSAAPVSRG